MYKESQIFNVEPRYLTAKQLVVIALVFMVAILNLDFWNVVSLLVNQYHALLDKRFKVGFEYLLKWVHLKIIRSLLGRHIGVLYVCFYVTISGNTSNNVKNDLSSYYVLISLRYLQEQLFVEIWMWLQGLLVLMVWTALLWKV